MGAGSASAGTAKISYAKTLPSLTMNVTLGTDTKSNNSKAKVVNSVVGSTYKTNMWHAMGGRAETKVSPTATGVTDNDTRNFTIDQSAVGRTIGLVAENAAWTSVTVEIAGAWYPDTK